jgi:hypothetical protein
MLEREDSARITPGLTPWLRSIANLGCDLDGTTAATCSGYSSYKSGYSNGFHTGPTEISWISTLTGSDVEWGVLTMAAKPTKSHDSLDIGASASPSSVSGGTAMPAQTDGAVALSSLQRGRLAMVAAALSAVCATVLL